MLRVFAQFFFFLFLIFLALYHGLHTFLMYSPFSPWIFGDIMTKVLVILVFFLVFLSIFYLKRTLQWISANWLILISIFLVILYVIFLSFVYHQKTVHDCIRGLQSSIIPLCFLLFGSFIGYVLVKKKEVLLFFEKFFFFFLFFLLLGSLIWQISKHIFPDLFFLLGFGPVGDWYPNTPPPIYFRTGPGGIPRLSGLFSGPNNYGYFLVVFSPLFFSFFKDAFLRFFGKAKADETDSEAHIFTTIPVFFKYVCVFLFFLSGVLTLSRGVLLGWFVSFCAFLLFSGLVSFSNIVQFLKKVFFQNKVIFFCCLVLFLFFFGLSWYKLGSSLDHIKHWAIGIQRVFQSPFFGYGLGSSGPGIHYTGFILPENFYLQLRLDGGLFYLLLWVICVVILVREYKKYDKYFFLLGFLGLLFVGFFLHIFEDTMVNLLICLPVGFFWGSEKICQESKN